MSGSATIDADSSRRTPITGSLFASVGTVRPDGVLHGRRQRRRLRDHGAGGEGHRERHHERAPWNGT